MSEEYRGYPLVVFISLPKCGTKSINKAFTDLGYKVADAHQIFDFIELYDSFGKMETDFKVSSTTMTHSNNSFSLLRINMLTMNMTSLLNHHICIGST